MAGDSTARFLEFAVDGDADALEAMIESQAVPVDVVESGSGGVTALCIAASRGHARAVKTLLRRGASPHKQHAKADPTGNTPLHFAAMGGSVEGAGADVRVRNKMGDTLLLHAAVSGKPDAVRWLLANGCSDHALIRNKRGVTAISAAARRAAELGEGGAAWEECARAIGEVAEAAAARAEALAKELEDEEERATAGKKGKKGERRGSKREGAADVDARAHAPGDSVETSNFPTRDEEGSLQGLDRAPGHHCNPSEDGSILAESGRESEMVEVDAAAGAELDGWTVFEQRKARGRGEKKTVKNSTEDLPRATARNEARAQLGGLQVGQGEGGRGRARAEQEQRGTKFGSAPEQKVPLPSPAVGLQRGDNIGFFGPDHRLTAAGPCRNGAAWASTPTTAPTRSGVKPAGAKEIEKLSDCSRIGPTSADASAAGPALFQSEEPSHGGDWAAEELRAMGASLNSTLPAVADLALEPRHVLGLDPTTLATPTTLSLVPDLPACAVRCALSTAQTRLGLGELSAAQLEALEEVYARLRAAAEAARVEAARRHERLRLEVEMQQRW